MQINIFFDIISMVRKFEGVKKIYILTINPGSTSTKVALFDGTTELARATLRHSAEMLNSFSSISDQLEFRLEAIEQFLNKHSEISRQLAAAVGRGGLLRPLSSGTYRVNERMLHDLRQGVQGQHASNLGGMLAHSIAARFGIEAFIVDPVSVDEFEPLARVSGIPQIERRSLSHALNIKAVAYRFAEDMQASLDEMNLIIAHLGGGISVAPLKAGRIIDVNNANEMGPFSPERAGGLPVGDVVRMCFSGEYSSAAELRRIFNGRSGFVGYLGTNDMREVERRIDEGDDRARLIWEAMGYQIAKEIGQMSVVLKGSVDAVLLTGGLAHSDRFTSFIAQHVEFIAPVHIYPGEDELQALAEGAVRVLTNKVAAKEY